MFGWEPHEVLGLPLCALFADEWRDAVDGLWRATPSQPISITATARDRNGLAFETEMTSTRTLAVANGAAGFVAIVRDVTEQRAVEAALFACSGAPDSAAALAAVRDAITDWVPLAKLELRLARGRRARRANGSSRRPHALLLLANNGRAYGTLNAVVAMPHAATPRVMRVLSAVAEAIGPAIAQTLELEQKSRTIGQLEQTERLEKELLALITHDMRTPLAVIAGVASYLRDNWAELPDGERLAELDAILRNGRSLTRLVEQDLEFALVASGQLTYDIAPFDIAAELDRTVGEFARAVSTRVSLRIERPLPLVDGDAQRNAQVLTNLLSNAVKFSAPGSVTEVHAVRRGTMVHVAVRDRGCGLTRADRAKVFFKFSRVAPGGEGRPPGTGLGLYLSKSMVEAQGGRISVDSRLGEGSTFTYTLPISSADRC